MARTAPESTNHTRGWATSWRNWNRNEGFHYGPQNTAEIYEDEKRLTLANTEKSLHDFLKQRVNEVEKDGDGITAVMAQHIVSGRVRLRRLLVRQLQRQRRHGSGGGGLRNDAGRPYGPVQPVARDRHRQASIVSAAHGRWT